jgi:hypothetical protein
MTGASDVTARMPHRSWLIVVALVFTGLNSAKPLQVDDAAYFYYAAQIAAHPLDPYGFNILWYDSWERANNVLAPPVLPAWWGLGIALFGDQPVAWKLWLFPFSVFLVFAFDSLARRFASGLEKPLGLMTIFSAVLLPGFNLMLDIPALALSLSAIVLFLDACDHCRWWEALLAGLVGGLATQTKYTGFLAPVVMLLYAAASGILTPDHSWLRALVKVGLALLAALVAAGVFIGWEAYVAHQYGESHFLHEYRGGHRPLHEQLLMWSVPLLVLIGGTAPYLGLLGLLAAFRRRWPVTFAALVIMAGYVVIACEEGVWTIALTPSRTLFGVWYPWTWRGSLSEIIFAMYGLAVALVALWVIGRLLRVKRGGLWRPRQWQRHWVDWFLVLWLGLETAGYFAMTPFAAVRRILGIVMVTTLLAGRLASRTCRSPGRRRWVAAVAAFSIVCGLGFYALDMRESLVRKQAAEDAAAWIRERDPRATIWYVGHWGFQYYAEHAGMKPLIVGQESQQLQLGDWLVVPDMRQNQQFIQLQLNRLKAQMELIWEDVIPLRTVQCYYGTATGAPLEHHEGARIRLTIYRVVGHSTAAHHPVENPPEVPLVPGLRTVP